MTSDESQSNETQILFPTSKLFSGKENNSFEIIQVREITRS